MLWKLDIYQASNFLYTKFLTFYSSINQEFRKHKKHPYIFSYFYVLDNFKSKTMQKSLAQATYKRPNFGRSNGRIAVEDVHPAVISTSVQCKYSACK